MNILIIDDSEDKIKKLENSLKDKGKITICKSRNRGLYKIIKESFDLIFLDMNLPFFENDFPQMNLGLSVLRELQRKKITIPVCIYSSQEFIDTKYSNVIYSIKYDFNISLKNDIEKLFNIYNNLKIN